MYSSRRYFPRSLSSSLSLHYSLPLILYTPLLQSGGSGLGALSALVESSPYSFRGFDLNIGVDEHEQKLAASWNAMALKKGKEKRKPKRIGVGREGGGKCAAKVWQSVT